MSVLGVRKNNLHALIVHLCKIGQKICLVSLFKNHGKYRGRERKMRLVKTIYPVNIFFFRAIRLSLIFFQALALYLPACDENLFRGLNCQRGRVPKFGRRNLVWQNSCHVSACIIITYIMHAPFDFGRNKVAIGEHKVSIKSYCMDKVTIFFTDDSFIPSGRSVKEVLRAKCERGTVSEFHCH